MLEQENKRNRTQKVRGVNTGNDNNGKSITAFQNPLIWSDINLTIVAGKRQGGMFLLDQEISCVSQNSLYKEFYSFGCEVSQVGMHYLLLPHQWRIKKDLHSLWIAFQAGCIRERQPGHSERQPVDNSIVLRWVIVCLDVGSWRALALSMSTQWSIFYLLPFCIFLYNFHMGEMM